MLSPAYEAWMQFGCSLRITFQILALHFKQNGSSAENNQTEKLCKIRQEDWTNVTQESSKNPVRLSADSSALMDSTVHLL